MDKAEKKSIKAAVETAVDHSASPGLVSKLASLDTSLALTSYQSELLYLIGRHKEDGKLRYVTAVSRFNIIDGRRDRCPSGDGVIDIESNEIVCEGLSTPHSLRTHNGQLWLHNYGTGGLGVVEFNQKSKGSFVPRVFCPRFLLGLVFHGNFFKGVATSMASMTGAVALFTGLWAGVASAANECGTNTPGPTVLTCVGGTYSNGIIYNTRTPRADVANEGDGMTLILDDANIIVSGAAVNVRTSDVNTGNITLNALNFGSITAEAGTFQRGFWIENRGTAGNVDVVIGTNAGSIQTNDGRQNGGVLASLEQLNAVGNVSVTWLGGSYASTPLGREGSVIWAFSRGTGTTHAEMSGGTGDLRGTNSRGVLSFISNPENTADATASFTGGSLVLSGVNSGGVRALTKGLGSASASMSGGSIEMSGDTGAGVFSQVNIGGGSSIATMTAGTITATGADNCGLRASNTGTGVANVLVSGDSIITTSGENAIGILVTGATYAVVVDDTASVTGGSGLIGAGIYIFSAADSSGTIVIGADATVDGSAGAAGIFGNAGNTIVTTSGTVDGDAILGLGSDVFNLTGGTYTGDIYGDGTDASPDDGNDTFNWSGGDLNSGFFGGNGSDTATISAGASYDGTEIMDGGDDYSNSDGWIDTLTFQGQTATTQGALVINWENVIIDGGAMAFSDNQLQVGAEAGTGLTLSNGGVLNAGSAFGLTGNLVTTAGGTFDGTGGGAGVYSISGSVANNGVITMQDGVVGDVVTVAGNYAGGGTLLVDVDFATDTSDTLNIGGNVTGAGTQVGIQDASNGVTTGNDVTVVSVAGTTTAGDFMLAAPVINGAFNYNTLALDGQNWVLQSVAVPGDSSAVRAYTPIASAIEKLGRSLLTLETLPTLNQRQSIVNNNNAIGLISSDLIAGEGGAWVRTVGGVDNINSDQSTTSADFHTDYEKIQVGGNLVLEENDNGRFILGFNASYSESDTDINAAAGNSDIASDGYSIGLTGTWYAATGSDSEGLYADLQAQTSWYESELSGNAIIGAKNGAGADSIDDIDSDGYSASVEMGKRISLKSSQALDITPQVQLMYSNVDFERFVGSNNVIVNPDDASSLKARVGLTLDGQINSKERSQTQGYLLANVVHEFDSSSNVQVTGASLTNDIDRWSGELGFGGSYVWQGQVQTTYTVFGEITASTSLNNFGDSNGMQGVLGIKAQF